MRDPVGMGCRITELVLDARDPESLADFWCEVLGWRVVDRRKAEVEIAGQDDAMPSIVFYRCNEPKQQKLRLHLDLRPVDRDHSAELSRLLDAGAVPTDIGQGETVWAVLADPEGNEFCLLHPLASS
jgi:catechol 2,3-dioxygenase-like lactoylglutathione lyase family enzyme